MNHPSDNFRIGQTRHQELEAEVSRGWGGEPEANDEGRSKRVGLIVVRRLGGISAILLLFLFLIALWIVF